MATRTDRLAACAVSFLLLLAGVAPVLAEEAGKITHLAGLLSATRTDGQKKLLGVDSTVSKGDLLTTEKDTYARIKFFDGSEMVLRPNSQLQIDDFRFNQADPEKNNMVLSMLKGGLRAITGLIGKRNPDSVRFGTPTSTIGIRGTHFGALFCQGDCGGLQAAGGGALPDGLHVDVVDGAIAVSNRAGEVVFNAGQFGFIRDASTLPTIVPREGGIRITIPSSISRNNAVGRVGVGQSADCVAQ